MRYISCFIIIIIYCCVSLAAQSASLDQGILLQREQKLENLTFEWQLTQNSVIPGSSQASLDSIRRQVIEQARDEAKRKHERNVDLFVQNRVHDIMSAEQGFSITATKLWRFDSHNGEMLVTGENQTSPMMVGMFREYYDKGVMVVVNDYNKDSSGQLMQKFPTRIGECVDCTRYRPPFDNGLWLGPEDFAILLGKNPLSMYGVSWTPGASNSDGWEYSAQVEHGTYSPFKILLKLSRKYNGLPISIKLSSMGGLKWIYNYNVLGYRKYNDLWVCDSATAEYKQPGLTRVRQWALKNITPCNSITFPIPKTARVYDYRLLGPALSAAQVRDASTSHDLNIVAYSWNDHIPDANELRRIRKENTSHSQKETPASMSGILAVIGFVCLVIGVWLMRRRATTE